VKRKPADTKAQGSSRRSSARAARLTTPDLVILALLRERPMHGYEIGQELVAREVQDWAGVSRPQVYYSLRKLHGGGLIRDVESAESAGPERTVYRMAAAGVAAMEKALSTNRWATQRPPNPFVTWIALSAHLPRPAFKRVADARLRFVQAQLAKERATLVALTAAPAGEVVALGRALVKLGIAQFEAELTWLERLPEDLAMH